MIRLPTAKRFAQQALILCLACMSNCSSVLEKQENKISDSLIPLANVNNLLSTYTEQEINLINTDLKNIREVCFRDKTPSSEPMYVAAVGGPGACKTTILEIFLHNKSNCVYTDPDQRGLKYMVNTYHQSLSNYENSTAATYADLQKNAYTKWRRASNYIADLILNEAFANGYNIAHGTTGTASITSAPSATSNAIEPLYKKLKQKNYKIILLLCYAPDETRIKANDYRANVQGFFQVSPEDAISKGKMFNQRFPTYFEYADKIYLYWTQDFLKGSVHAATYEKGKALVVNNREALNSFIKKYDEDRKDSQIPSLDELIQKQLKNGNA